ncbi:vesicular glutamate transporter 2-like [Pecten maximus]|uniref:vesicular glutamate transporter 2-like n=1 Tax=Pecten maximus TaxID=6579 RepID=UPI001457FFB5|nr:vesicular glutamate transporter 2-like [Pecten maximus]
MDSNTDTKPLQAEDTPYDDTYQRKTEEDRFNKEDVSKFETKHSESSPEKRTGPDSEFTQENRPGPENEQRTCYIPRRYVTSFLTGLGMLLVYAMRTNIGLTAITLIDTSSAAKVEATENLPTSFWTTRSVALLHSSFYLGYIITHIPAGYLTVIWPCNRIYGLCILISASLNFLLPYTIDTEMYTVSCAVRFVQGLSEGLLYPSCYGILRHWSTPSERGRIVSAVLTGSYAAPVLGFPVAGFVTHYIGWEYVFYVSGGACVVWYAIWMCVISEKPSHDPHISDEELDFLTTSQGDSSLDYENMKIPWWSIVTSLPVIALCACNIARNWVYILMLTNEPYYLNNFDFTVAENGVLSSIPHIFKVLAAIISGFIADFVIARRRLNTTVLRKLLTTLGFGGQSICFLVLTFTVTPSCVMVFLTLGVGMFGLSVSGWQINHYDLAPRYAGVLVSITSASGAAAAIVVPIVAGELTLDNEMSGWNKLFYITIAIVMTALIIYLIFGSGQEQRWAHPPPDIKLVQKQDPLARKPYNFRLQQRLSVTPEVTKIVGNTYTEHSQLVKRTVENIPDK